ncbi:MAG: PorV/PorQ family protein [Candidatus Marinimicrobia bacterium]|nr:PorV/PorQ family protein [Candidatus Neomarinimicrobiota bacterium]
MQKILRSFFIIIILLSQFLFSEEKLAQTGFQFLSVCSDARASALGQAMTAVEANSSSLFFNPATMAKNDKFIDVSFSNNPWIASIQHNSLSFSVNPGKQYGIFGLSFKSVNYGELQGTINWPNEKGYYETNVFEPTAFIVGIGYAKQLNNKLSIGGQLSKAYQYLGKSVVSSKGGTNYKNNNTTSIAMDFGTYLETGFKSLAFGMSVRNFSNEIKYEDESFQLPLNFTLGVSMDMMDLTDGINTDKHSLLLAVDATHPRSHREQIKFGIDYSLLNMLNLRAGYIMGNDENDVAFGAGISKFGLAFDYAVIPFGVFGNVTQFTMRLSL